MKDLKIDCYGNIITGMTAILILVTIISSIILITTIMYINDENSASVANDNFRYIITDYKNNLNKLLLDSLIELSEDIIEKKSPSKNSHEDIKKKY